MIHVSVNQILHNIFFLYKLNDKTLFVPWLRVQYLFISLFSPDMSMLFY